jgi:hypothetical protein
MALKIARQTAGHRLAKSPRLNPQAGMKRRLKRQPQAAGLHSNSIERDLSF